MTKWCRPKLRDSAPRAQDIRCNGVKPRSQIAQALSAADEYARIGPTTSTRLRDARIQTLAFAAELRGLAGYSDEALPVLADLVAQRPQDVALRTQYADALMANGFLEEAEQTLQEIQRLLSAVGEPRVEIVVRLAAIRLRQGDEADAREAARPLLSGERPAPAEPLWVRVLAELGELDQARETERRLPPAESPAARAETAITGGRLAELAGDASAAVSGYRAALEENRSTTKPASGS